MELNLALQAPTLESAAARLLAAAKALAAAQDLPGLMEVVRHAARDLTDADGVTFVLREGDLVHYADEDAISPLWKGQRFPATACISGWAMIHRQTVVIEDIYADDRIPHGAYRPTFVKSLAMVPVRPEDPVAAIGSYWARRHRATQREVELVESLAGLTSVALANVALVAELRHAVKAREDFLEAAAHELRTPMTPIVLQAGAALRALDRENVAAAREAIARVQRGLDRAVALANELIDISSELPEEPLALQRKPVELTALVRDVVDRYRAEHGPRLGLSVDGPVTGRWDHRRIAQVVENLVANALKFGGEREIEVRVEQGGDVARLVVADHGIGIAPEDQARIFERFERAASLRHFGGLGLGLWLVRRCVEAHGGTVEVASSLGQGSTFTVSLPLAESAGAAESAVAIATQA